MKSLSKFWFSTAPIDFEHKQYVLLDFLQSVDEQFSTSKIYPALSALSEQVCVLNAFKDGRDSLNDRLKNLKSFNWNTMELEYE